MRHSVLASAAVAAALLAGCGGDSKQEKALANVCDARADIQKQVDTLKGLTVTSATTNQVKDALDAIRKDLQTMADNRSDLADARRKEVDAANEAFKSEVQNVATTVGRTLALGGAKTQLQDAFAQLADGYKSAFQRVDCS
jgi:hypothetical protein